MEERRGTRVYEMLTNRAQELSDALGMTDAPQSRTYGETAAQTDQTSQGEVQEDRSQYIYTAEDETDSGDLRWTLHTLHTVAMGACLYLPRGDVFLFFSFFFGVASEGLTGHVLR